MSTSFHHVARAGGAKEVVHMDLITGGGRVGRLHYFFFSIGLGVVVFLIVFLLSATGGDGSEGSASAGAGLLMVVTALASVWLSYTNMIRRLHDCGRSGWLVLLSLVPIINIGLSLYLLFMPGDVGANRYGGTGRPGDVDALKAKLEQVEMARAALAARSATGGDGGIGSGGGGGDGFGGSESESGAGGNVAVGSGYLNADGTFNMDGLDMDGFRGPQAMPGQRE